MWSLFVAYMEIPLSSKAMKIAEEELRKLFIKTSHKGFYEGEMTVIQILSDAMKISELEYIPKMWLDTAEKEVKRWKK